MKKNDRFFATYNGKIYEVAGRWCGSIVLSPQGEDAECLLYTESEMEELLELGKFHDAREVLKVKALFARKVSNLEELKAMTQAAFHWGKVGQPYEIIRDVMLEDDEFRLFARDFFEDQPWIAKNDGGMNADGKVRCIRVVNTKTGEKILVNPEGYSYARYVAIEW